MCGLCAFSKEHSKSLHSSSDCLWRQSFYAFFLVIFWDSVSLCSSTWPWLVISLPVSLEWLYCWYKPFPHLSLYCWGAMGAAQQTLLLLLTTGKASLQHGRLPSLGPIFRLAALSGMNSIPRTSSIRVGLRLLTFITNVCLHASSCFDLTFNLSSTPSILFAWVGMGSLIPMKATLHPTEQESGDSLLYFYLIVYLFKYI